MKKIILLIILLFITCACSNNTLKDNIKDNTSNSLKYELKLGHNVDENISDTSTTIQSIANIKIDELEEINDLFYEEGINTQIDKITLFINKKYPNLINNNWSYSVNYFNESKTSGIIKFNYMINKEIYTNKGIVCSIDNNKVTIISYTNIDMDTAEEKLVEQKDESSKYIIQEKKKLNENEEFIEEKTYYTYYYNIDKLVYTYNLFYYDLIDNMKIENNSTLSEYYVEEVLKDVKYDKKS